MNITERVKERFWKKVGQEEGCWEWTASGDGIYGYGHLVIAGRIEKAHRVSWEIHHGPISPGLWVLHECDNPPCVRPDHLFLGTAATNAADRNRKGRGAMQQKTHCPQGHPYAGENLYVRPDGKRICRECTRISQLKYDATRRKQLTLTRATSAA